MTYLALGLGAALENIVPPVPADTFVLFGAFVAARGIANPWIVWAVVLASNVGSALLVYGLARRYGERVFETKFGSWLLNRQQLDKVGGFYQRWGIAAIFFSRFLPAFRAVVPIFAGVSDVAFAKAALPMLAASGLWYGFLVYLGYTAGENLQAILDAFGSVSHILLWIALALGALLVFWWWRSRRSKD